MEIETSVKFRKRKNPVVHRAVKYFAMEMSRAEALRSLDNDPRYKLKFLIEHNSLFYLRKDHKASDLAIEYMKM